MTPLDIVGWLTLAAGLGSLVPRLAGRRTVGWAGAAALGVAGALLGLATRDPAWITAAGLTVLVGVVLPVRLMAWARRRALAGDYAGAARWARWATLGRRDPRLRLWAEVWAAADAFHRDDPGPAEALQAWLAAEGWTSFAALLTALRRDWAQARFSPAVDLQARALCELGEVEAGVEAAARLWAPRMRWPRIVAARAGMLAPLAFAGRVRATRRLARLLRQPPAGVEAWTATARAAAGEGAAARRTLEALRARADLPPALRHAVGLRLAHLPAPPELGPAARAVLDDAEGEVTAGALLRLRPPWRAPTTLLALAAMIGGFVAQALSGGTLSGAVAYDLGALLTDGALPAERWRLFAYALLHHGLPHLLANAVAVAAVGPVVGRALGQTGAAVVLVGSVLLAGVGISLWGTPGLTLGASGGAMGLVGALVIVAARHPRCRRRRTGRAVARLGLVVLGAQVLFDAAMPQSSSVGHAVGALAGALLATGWMALGGWRTERG